LLHLHFFLSLHLMKLLPFFAATALVLASASATQAQDYRPFSPGITYHFAQAGSTASAETQIHMFRVDSVGTLGGDSVFYFNRNCHYGPNNVFTRLTLFGAAFRWHAPTGKATFVGAGGNDTVQILTRGPIGRQWNFTRSVQATIQSRQVQQVLGQPDSILTIALSDGQTLQCSRTYGLVSGPALFSYLGTSYLYRTTPFTTKVCGLPERHMGAVDLRPVSLYNHQVGDSLFFRESRATAAASPNPTCISSTIEVTVEQASLTAAADFLLLQTRIQYAMQPCAGGPITPFWMQGITSIPLDTVWLTGETAPYGFGMWVVSPGLLHPDSLAGLPRLPTRVLGGMGNDQFATYAPGLGEVAYASGFGPNQPNDRRRLVGFVKGGMRWGNTTTLQPLGLTAAHSTRLGATVAPNPVAATNATASVRFTLEPAQAVTATQLALLDGVGRVVWQQSTRLAAGEQAVAVPMAHLTAGLYHLRLTLADGRQQMLPLVRE
jgi:hypothetical protein